MFEIDPSDLHANVNAAQARLTGVEATLATARQNLHRYDVLIAEQATGQNVTAQAE